MNVHVKIWVGSGCATVTDMTNAGRRGKKCRVLRFSGVCWDEWSVKGDRIKVAAVRLTRDALRYLNDLADAAVEFGEEDAFDDVRKFMMTIMNDARKLDFPDGPLSLYDEEIRGIDAPKPPLTAGVPGIWSAKARGE